MPTITLSVTEDLKKRMDKQGIINWSAVARNSIEETLNDLEIFEKIVKKSKLTEKDAKKIADKIKTGMATRHKL